MKPRKDLLITFKLGSAELTDQGRANALVFATALKEAPQLAGAKVQLCGYTDSTGRGDRNRELSQRRADAVRTFLIAEGVDGSRLTTKGYGAQDFLPGLPSSAEENRRVVAVKE
jgi:outer membrane protein OmpA-like peptidoglycan-associated protein